MNTLMHTTETQRPATEAPDLGQLVLHPTKRTTPEDLRAPRWGKKSDLSWRTSDGIEHPVTVKRAGA